MYSEYVFPYLSIPFSNDLSKDEKKGLKLLKKAEKADDFSQIIQNKLFLSMIYTRSLKYDEAEKSINDALSILVHYLSPEDSSRAKLILGIVQALQNKAESSQNLTEAETIISTLGNKILLYNVKLNLGILHLNQQKYKFAGRNLQESLSLAKELSSSLEIAQSQLRLGLLKLEIQEYVKSKNLINKALKNFTELKRDLDCIRALRYLCRVHFLEKKFKEASNFIFKAIEISHKNKNEEYQSELAWSNLVLIELYLQQRYLQQKDNLGIFQVIDRTTEIFSQLGDKQGLAKVLIAHATFLIRINDADEVEPMLLDAFNMYDSLDEDFNIAEIYFQIGLVLITNDDKEIGEEFLNRAKVEYQNSTDKSLYPNFLFRKGKQYLLLQDYDRCIENLNEAASKYNEIDDKFNYAFSLKMESKGYIGKTQYDDAEKLLNDALDVFNKLDDNNEKAYILKDIADLMILTKDIEKSVKYQEEALAIFEKLGVEQGQLIMNCNLASNLKRMNKIDESTKLLKSIIDLADNADISKVLPDIAQSYLDYGNVLLIKGNINEARLKFQRSRDLFERLSDKQGLSNSNARLALTMYIDNQIVKAAEYIKNALVDNILPELEPKYANILNEINRFLIIERKEPKTVCKLYQNIGNLLEQDGKFNDAIKSYMNAATASLVLGDGRRATLMGDKSLQLLEKTNNFKIKLEIQFTICSAIIQSPTPDFDRFFTLIEEVRKGFEEQHELSMVGETYIVQGNANMRENAFEDAVANYYKAIKILEKTGNLKTLLVAYDSLVDSHFANAKFADASAFLDKQINYVLQNPSILGVTNLLRIYYAKQLALNIAMNNYKNALGLINQIQQQGILIDQDTQERLHIEKFCLLFLDGQYKIAWDDYKKIPIPSTNPLVFYSQLNVLYRMFYNRIGRISIFYHLMGDLHFSKGKYKESVDYYQRAKTNLREELRYVHQLSKKEFLVIFKILEVKATNAQTSYEASTKLLAYTKGSSIFPCLRCIGKGNVEITLPSGKISSRCPLCKGTGKYVQT